MKCYKIEEETLREFAPDFETSAVCVCTPDELRRQTMHFAPHTIEECEHEGPSKLEAYDGYDFIILNVANEEHRFTTNRVGLFASAD
ncbi:MAG: hypothetical protein E7518_05650 [Ruminococcaceae bacterium]|nr:hypothetical protein [Oscillospiraceae bacterium]